MEEKSQLWEEQLPYEKFEAFGPEYLTDAELIAILLRTGTRDCNAVELARQILALGSQTGQSGGPAAYFPAPANEHKRGRKSQGHKAEVCYRAVQKNGKGELPARHSL